MGEPNKKNSGYMIDWQSLGNQYQQQQQVIDQHFKGVQSNIEQEIQNSKNLDAVAQEAVSKQPLLMQTKEATQKYRDIAELQTALKALKYNLGTSGKNKDGVDGMMGRRTKEALADAQKKGYVLHGNKLLTKEEFNAMKAKETPVQQQQTSNSVNRSMSGGNRATANPGKYSLAANMPKTEPNKPSEGWEKAGQYVSNLFRAPVQATVDGALYVADRMGAPSNATNYLRDLNVSIPYRIKNAVHAGVNTLVNDKTFSENYNALLANPSAFTDYTTIRPLTNTNGNFSEEELGVIRDMAGKDFKISNADIKRVSEDGNYGGRGDVSTYFTPTKVVQTALGQTSGNADDKTITDIFDVNTVGSTAQRDNQMYINMAKENPGANYQTMRATMPFLNMIDIMPDKYKIKTKIDFNE